MSSYSGGPKVGQRMKLYRNSGTTATPVWQEISDVGDVTLDGMELGTAELKRRSSIWVKVLAALFSAFNLNVQRGARPRRDDLHRNAHRLLCPHRAGIRVLQRRHHQRRRRGVSVQRTADPVSLGSAAGGCFRARRGDDARLLRGRKRRRGRPLMDGRGGLEHLSRGLESGHSENTKGRETRWDSTN